MTPSLLDRILGPRAWCVITEDGTYFPVIEADTSDDINVVVARGLREGPAFRKARALRCRGENIPRDVI